MKSKKFIFTLILIGYIYLLYKVYILSPYIVSIEGTGVYSVRVFSELFENGNIEYYKNICTTIVGMIPLGFLYPLSKGKRCLSGTLTFSAFLSTLFELLQFAFSRGTTCFDDIVFSTIGAWLGYKLFLFVCKHTSDGKDFLWPPKEKSKAGFLAYLLLALLLISIVYNVNNDALEIAIDKIDINKVERREVKENKNIILPSTSESIYETILTAMQEHKPSYKVSGIYGVLTPDEIYSEFKKVLDDHPELFWLTGGSEGISHTSGPTTWYMITPNVNCDLRDVPEKENQLNYVVDNVIQLAQTYDSDYDKVVFVHDYIVTNCEYDINAFYSTMYATDDVEIRTHAYDCYGCLVEQRAVCSGYAKAYKLILNRLGIECDVVTGQGYNELGMGPHAWNSVVIDGIKYYVDVTWDDPITDGYVLDTIPRDYLLISKEEISVDHFED